MQLCHVHLDICRYMPTSMPFVPTNKLLKKSFERNNSFRIENAYFSLALRSLAYHIDSFHVRELVCIRENALIVTQIPLIPEECDGYETDVDQAKIRKKWQF